MGLLSLVRVRISASRGGVAGLAPGQGLGPSLTTGPFSCHWVREDGDMTGKDEIPQFWLDGFAEDGVPNWAALQAWDEARDEDTVMEIKARAREIASAKP